MGGGLCRPRCMVNLVKYSTGMRVKLESLSRLEVEPCSVATMTEGFWSSYVEVFRVSDRLSVGILPSGSFLCTDVRFLVVSVYGGS